MYLQIIAQEATVHVHASQTNYTYLFIILYQIDNKSQPLAII